MNATLKTICLTVLALSAFTIALIELSGVSKTAFMNKYIDKPNSIGLNTSEQEKRNNDVHNMPATLLEVVQTKFDFGTITDGDKVRHTWAVKNIGDKPLMIANVQTSCGCTAPFFPKEPILPQQSSEITLEFNSAGKVGHVEKNALIIANATNAPFSIGFTANVEKKK